MKNHVLDYLGDFMEHSHDFGYHVVLSVKMEEEKIDCSDTDKIDRVLKFMHIDLLNVTAI